MSDDYTQPALFDDHDGQRQAPTAEPASAHTCPYCGTREPNRLLLRSNHGLDHDTAGIGGHPPGRHPIYAEMCLAQYLAANHIVYAVRVGHDTELAEAAGRARQLGLDPDAIIAAERHTDPQESPQED